MESQSQTTIKSTKKQLIIPNLRDIIKTKCLDNLYKTNSIVKNVITKTTTYKYIYDNLYKTSIEELECYEINNYLTHIQTLYVNNFIETNELSNYIPIESILQLSNKTVYKIQKKSNLELVCEIINGVDDWYFLVYNNNENNVLVKQEIASILAL